MAERTFRPQRISRTAFPHLLAPVLVSAIAIQIFIPLCVYSRGLPVRAGDVKIPVQKIGATDVTLKDLLEYKLEAYKTSLERFDSNLKLQAVFMVVILLLLIRRSKSLQVFDNEIPLQWLHMLAPAVMLYLWLAFGFLLDDLIEARICAAQIISELSIDDRNLALSTFQDAGLIDGWIMSFVDAPVGATGSQYGSISGINHNFQGSTSGFLVLVLGLQIAVSHACTIAIVAVGIRRYLCPEINSRTWPYYLVPLFPVFVFLMSHKQFAYGGDNRNWLQPVAAVLTLILLWLLIALSLRVDQSVDPASLRALKRSRLVNAKYRPRPGLVGNRNGTADTTEAAIRVSLIGDSLSTSFYVGPLLPMIVRIRSRWQPSWFADEDESDVLQGWGVADRLASIKPVVAINHATAKGRINKGGHRGLMDQLLGVHHMSHQVDEMLLEGPPDVALFWIGHNNTDWFEERIKLTEFDGHARKLVEEYEVQVRRVANAARGKKKKCTIVVFGLVNFESFFLARTSAEAINKSDTARYPYLKYALRYFQSMKHDCRATVSLLAQRINHELQEMCKNLNAGCAPDVTVLYSSAMSKAPITSAHHLNSFDAWHPSSEGHRVLAAHAFDDVLAAIQPPARRGRELRATEISSAASA